MAKRKYFITKRLIHYLLRKYGEKIWFLHEDISERDCVVYTCNNGCMLTINQMWESKDNRFPYIQINITDKNGVIIRRDRYDFLDTDKRKIEFVYTEEQKQIIYEFTPIKLKI